jgi:hypothetical protein
MKLKVCKARTDTSTLEPALTSLKFIVFMAHITHLYESPTRRLPATQH